MGKVLCPGVCFCSFILFLGLFLGGEKFIALYNSSYSYLDSVFGNVLQVSERDFFPLCSCSYFTICCFSIILLLSIALRVNDILLITDIKMTLVFKKLLECQWQQQIDMGEYSFLWKSNMVCELVCNINLFILFSLIRDNKIASTIFFVREKKKQAK